MPAVAGGVGDATGVRPHGRRRARRGVFRRLRAGRRAALLRPRLPALPRARAGAGPAPPVPDVGHPEGAAPRRSARGTSSAGWSATACGCPACSCCTAAGWCGPTATPPRTTAPTTRRWPRARCRPPVLATLRRSVANEDGKRRRPACGYNGRMPTAGPDLDTVRRLVRDAALAPDFRRATFGGGARRAVAVAARRRPPRGPARRAAPPVRLLRRPQDRHQELTAGRKPRRPLDELLALGFAGIHLSTAAEEIDVRTTKKGKVRVGRRPAAPGPRRPAAPHNRVKDVPLPEGRADRLLEAMGILDPRRPGAADHAGEVHADQRIPQAPRATPSTTPGCGRSAGRSNILDCGCGSSYLTLAAHHYLNDVLGVPARVARRGRQRGGDPQERRPRPTGSGPTALAFALRPDRRPSTRRPTSCWPCTPATPRPTTPSPRPSAPRRASC